MKIFIQVLDPSITICVVAYGTAEDRLLKEYQNANLGRLSSLMRTTLMSIVGCRIIANIGCT